MGTVYRARTLDGSAVVALKIQHPQSSALVEETAAPVEDRFRREAQTLRELDHPGVVGYLDHGKTEDGRTYLVMPWLEGEDLGARLLREPLLPDEILELGIRVTEALNCVHASGVIHRDLKPSNLFLELGLPSRVLVIDFGLARSTEHARGLTSTGQFLGTPAYAAPEQISSLADELSDIYSLGVVLFECLARRLPFVAESAIELIVARRQRPAPALSLIRPDVSVDLERLIAAMLERDPKRRPQSMAEVGLELARCLGRHERTPNADGSVRERRSERPQLRVHAADTPGSIHEPTSTTRRWLPRLAAQSGATAPAPFVGRQRELALLQGMWHEAQAESVLRVLRLKGKATIGKSRLVQASCAQLGVRLVHLQCAKLSRAKPLALIAALVSGCSGPDPELVSRAEEFVSAWRSLGTITASFTIAALQKAQDELSWRLSEWVESLLAHQLPSGDPTKCATVVLVEGLSHADFASRRALGELVPRLQTWRCLLVLETNDDQPDAPPFAGELELTLGSLGTNAHAELASHLLGAQPEPALYEATGGNPGVLLSLLDLRRESEGQRSSAATSFAMGGAIESFHDLDDAVKDLVGAAAIFQNYFQLAALPLLLGAGKAPRDYSEQSAFLQQAGIWEEASSVGAPPGSLRFLDARVRELAVTRLSATLRAQMHLCAAEYLKDETSDPAALEVAEHFLQSSSAHRAVSFLLTAARASVVAGDAAQAQVLIDLGLSFGSGEHALALQLLQIEQAHFRADLSAAESLAREALRRAESSHARLQITAWLITILGQKGRNDEVISLLVQLVATAVATEDYPAWAAAVSRALAQLAPVDRTFVEQYLPLVLERLHGRTLHPESEAWIARAKSWLCVDRDIDGSLTHWVTAERAHALAGDRRASVLMQIFLVSHYVWLGAHEAAEAAAHSALTGARKLGSNYLEVWGRYARAKLSVETRPLSDAAKELEHVIAATADSPRIRAGAWLYLGIARYRAGDLEGVLVAAQAAKEAHTAGAVVVPALALECLAWAVQKKLKVATLAELTTRHADVGLLAEHETLVRFSLYLGAISLGQHERAMACGEAWLARIDQLSKTVLDPVRREQFRVRPWIHGRFLEELTRAADRGPVSPPRYPH
jgi:tRNA A-37 threonylcarbamoyl transferase component Bud32/tetratricopeptide (TPR) repeat protein